MTAENFGGLEVLQIIESVAREKAVPKEAVISALEGALKVAAKRKYGHESEIRAEIDRKSGEVKLYREVLVVENLEKMEALQAEGMMGGAILASDQKATVIGATAGDVICEALPPLDIGSDVGRIAAQAAKQFITSRMREIERELQYQEFITRVGEVVHGIVDKVEYGNVIVKIGNAEALLARDAMLKADQYKQGDRVKAYLLELNPDNRGPQIILSRTDKRFLAKLFAQEVPEIYEGIITIKAVVRDPGSRAKIAVHAADDTSIDPVGSCVGIRGSRVQAVIAELKGEKIDIIEWSPDIGSCIVSALAPATVLKVIIDEEQHRIEVVVPDEQQSIAIGRQGQNVKLASELTGWHIDILTEAKESKRRQEEFSIITNRFMNTLDLEETLAQLLTSLGFRSIEELAAANISELAEIQGLDMTIAEELVSRAQQYIAACNNTISSDDVLSLNNKNSCQDNSHSLLSVSGMTEVLAHKLASREIDDIQKLADLSRDEFIELFPDTGLNNAEIDSIIMGARRVVYPAR